MRYLFGDSDLAARRLEVVHAVFAPASRHLLQEVVDQGIGLVADLGCGPGACTRFLAEVTRCDRAVGLDSSERFIALAREHPTERVAFHLHDVTEVPFPVGPSDLVYGRLLLTHLHDPGVVLGRWASQVRPGGQLIVEEVELIETEQPTLRAYLDVLAAVMARRGTELYIGAGLDRIGELAGMERELSRVARIPVATAQAATMFRMNLETWGNDDDVTARLGSGAIDALRAGLRELVASDRTRVDIEWGMRQIVYRRHADATHGAPGS
jgi:SAM-dependent methyltransferase